MDCVWIGWCGLEQSAQAAWAQAVFSVVGIGVAILVPYFQHKNAAKLRALDAQALAVSRAAALIKHVKAYAARVDSTKEAFDQRNLAEHTWSAGWPAPPNELQAAAATLHELGQPGTELIKAMHHSLEAKDLLDTNWNVNEATLVDYERHLEAAFVHVHAALRGTRKLLES